MNRLITRYRTACMAVVKIDATDLPVVKLGDSTKVNVGDWAIAVGNPFGLEHTVTVGVISAKAREIDLSLNRRSPGDYFQTDASINPGNSGGPLCDIYGRVIGINNAIYSRSGGNIGIGFAIPINTARDIADRLVKFGKIRRGYPGISIRDVEDLAVGLGLPKGTKGVLVNDVSPNTPASRAGLQPGDVIQKFNGQTVTKSTELQRLVGDAPVGSKATLEVLRGGKMLTLNVTLEELKDEADNPAPAPDNNDNGDEAQGEPTALGMNLLPLTPERVRRNGLGDAKGVIVTAVQPNSPAAQAGIRAGDLIERVGSHAVSTPDEAKQAMQEILKGQTGDEQNVVLYLNRKGERQFITVTIEK
jgi:serine protease Do